MELRQIRYFIAVAEELSFTRAALRLNISQPPLSQQIKSLEDELGTRLLDRTPRGAALTDAGQSLLTACYRVVAELDHAVLDVSRAAKGEIGRARIGATSSALFCIFPGFLAHVRQVVPAAELEILEMSSQQQVEALLKCAIDIGILHSPGAIDGLVLEEIYREPLCLALPEDYRRDGVTRKSLTDYQREPFIFCARATAPMLFDSVVGTCIRAGFSPKIAHTAGNLVSLLQMVRLGLGVALLPRSLLQQEAHEICVLPLGDEAAHISMHVAYRDSARSGLIDKIIEMSHRRPL